MESGWGEEVKRIGHTERASASQDILGSFSCTISEKYSIVHITYINEE